jgi:hypothetical protein
MKINLQSVIRIASSSEVCKVSIHPLALAHGTWTMGEMIVPALQRSDVALGS